MSNNQRRNIALAFGAAAGGLLAAAYLSTAVAHADDYVYLPDPSSFSVVSPPAPIDLPPFYEAAQGADAWNIFDTTTNTPGASDALEGNDSIVVLGSGPLATTFNDFVEFNSPSMPGALGSGAEIDLVQLPGGFGNELIDTLGTGDPGSGLTDILLTPTGDFTLF